MHRWWVRSNLNWAWLCCTCLATERWAPPSGARRKLNAFLMHKQFRRPTRNAFLGLCNNPAVYHVPPCKKNKHFLISYLVSAYQTMSNTNTHTNLFHKWLYWCKHLLLTVLLADVEGKRHPVEYCLSWQSMDQSLPLNMRSHVQPGRHCVQGNSTMIDNEKHLADSRSEPFCVPG